MGKNTPLVKETDQPEVHHHNVHHHHHNHHAQHPEQPPSQGYMQLAGFMSAYPEGAIFRRFGELTMLHLLYVQARIKELETQYIHSVNMQGGPLFSVVHDSPTVMFQLRDVRELSHDQRDVLEKVGPLVSHYNTLLLQTAQLAERWSPGAYEHQFLGSWIDGLERSGRSMKEEELRIWRKAPENDFVALCSTRERGAPISSLVSVIANAFRNGCVGTSKDNLQQSLLSGDIEAGQSPNHERSRRARDAELLRKAVTTLGASLFPVVTILTLFFIDSTLNRIYATLGFTLGFGMLFKIFTNSGMRETFMACATLAAVEVVFIGSADGRR